jgi:hypothetical protein
MHLVTNSIDNLQMGGKRCRNRPLPTVAMKTLVFLLAAAALLAGCATPQPELQARPETTRSLAKIELLYNEEDQFTVVDGGGSAIVGLAGLLGPVGTLVALGFEVGSRANLGDRNERRSKEFMAAVKNDSTAARSLSRQFAEKFAARLRESGREVKLTPAFRVNGPVAEMRALGHRPTPGYGTLTMRITAAYGAPDSTSSFKPFVAVEQVLRDEQQSVVYQATHTANLNEPAYFLYDGLLQDAGAAREGLRQGFAQAVQPAYSVMFGEEGPLLAGNAEPTRTAGLGAASTKSEVK